VTRQENSRPDRAVMHWPEIRRQKTEVSRSPLPISFVCQAD